MIGEQYMELRNAWFPDELRITSVEDAEQLHQAFIDFGFELRLKFGFHPQPHYRGEQHYGWDVRPGLFRLPLVYPSAAEGKEKEKEGIVEFEKVIDEHVGPYALRRIYNHMRFGKSWDLLFQAQHAGVKTSLTDWSARIYNPLFFAIEESNLVEMEGADAQLWWFMVRGSLIWGHSVELDSFYERDPFHLNEHMIINPAIFLDDLQKRLFENRMFTQLGRFFISPRGVSDVPVNLQTDIAPFLYRICIPADCKVLIRKQLAERGTDRQRIYVEEDVVLGARIRQLNESIFTP